MSKCVVLALQYHGQHFGPDFGGLYGSSLQPAQFQVRWDATAGGQSDGFMPRMYEMNAGASVCHASSTLHQRLL